MQQIKTNTGFFVLFSALLTIGCNESSTTTEKKDKDSVQPVAVNETPAMPAYDPAMDPLTVGAEMSKKLGDTLGIKMYEFTMKPGDSALLHYHPDHTAYVLQGGQMAITFQGSGRQILDLQPGFALISGPVTDAAKNVGTTTIKMLIHDIYRPRSK